MHLIVAAGGGERDYAVDGQILTGLRQAENPGVFLNERLMGDLRPTLFLAQLSNLLAGNISIVHGVTGASRTFMGEESSGVDAIRIAQARIASGQNDIFLVGGAYNAERPDVLLIYEMGGFLWKKPFRPVFERAADGGGMILGQRRRLPGAGIARARRARAARRPIAAIAGVARRPRAGASRAASQALADAGAPARSRPDVVLSGATGVAGHHRGGAARRSRRLAPEAAIHATRRPHRPYAWRRRRRRASRSRRGADRAGHGRRGARDLRRPLARRGRRSASDAGRA